MGKEFPQRAQKPEGEAIEPHRIITDNSVLEVTSVSIGKKFTARVTPYGIETLSIEDIYPAEKDTVEIEAEFTEATRFLIQASLEVEAAMLTKAEIIGPTLDKNFWSIKFSESLSEIEKIGFNEARVKELIREQGSMLENSSQGHIGAMSHAAKKGVAALNKRVGRYFKAREKYSMK
jgi:hypothetical protein